MRVQWVVVACLAVLASVSQGVERAPRAVADIWTSLPDPLQLGRADVQRSQQVAECARRGDWKQVLARVAWWEPAELRAALPNDAPARAFARSNASLLFARDGNADPVGWATLDLYEGVHAGPDSDRASWDATRAAVQTGQGRDHVLEVARTLMTRFPASPYVLPVIVTFLRHRDYFLSDVKTMSGPERDQAPLELLRFAAGRLTAPARVQALVLLARLIIEGGHAQARAPLLAVTRGQIERLDSSRSFNRALALRELLAHVTGRRVSGYSPHDAEAQRLLQQLERSAPGSDELVLGRLAAMQLDPQAWAGAEWAPEARPAAELTLALFHLAQGRTDVAQRLLASVAANKGSAAQPFGYFYLAQLRRAAGDVPGTIANLEFAADAALWSPARVLGLYGIIFDDGVREIIKDRVIRSDCQGVLAWLPRWGSRMTCGLGAAVAGDAMRALVARCRKP